MSRRTITFHYILKDGTGRLIDTSRGGAPMPFTEGAGQIIEGLEEQLLLMAAGEKRTVVVPPERAYGARDASLVQKVPRARLPVADLKVGDQFQTGPDRSAPIVTVVAVEGDEVLLDANHPMAGQELHFEVEVVAVRAAAPEELPPAPGAS
ncbi:MAG: peptidylprolyl isomerase [bacterium]|nr:peptidylprolyl isomerase [bacterium]MDI1334789.1 peptidylprolyl isomerase [Lacunisphaera sp.]